MKIAISRNIPKGSPWVWKSFDDRYPAEIRSYIRELLDLEGRINDEIFLMTLNRTVIDMIRHKYSKEFLGLSYDDVYVDLDGELVLLTELHDQEYLSHFSLGDLFERGEI